MRAGERAERAYAWVTASERYAAALAMMPADDTVTYEHVLLLIRTAHLYRYAEPRKGTTHLEAAVRLAGNDRALKAHATFELGMLRFITGDTREALAELEASVAAFDMLTPDEMDTLLTLGVGLGADKCHGTLAYFLATVGRCEEALAHGNHAWRNSPLRSDTRPWVLGTVTYARGWGRYMRG